MKSQSIFLTAEWKHLAMLNYEVDPAILAKHLPVGTELDTWKGKTFVSMVAFLFLRTSVLDISIPFYRNFEEVNLRFYVRRKAEGNWRRGVVFIKEIIARAVIAAMARHYYQGNYISLRMRHQIDTRGEKLRIDSPIQYAWRCYGQWQKLSVLPSGEAKYPKTGSEEEFITEHYWRYTKTRDGGCLESRVVRPQWRIWQVSRAFLECDVKSLYGAEFSEPLSGAPYSAFLAEGSKVAVLKGEPIY